MSKLYAGFIKAERESKEMVTIPAYCLADDEQHAMRTLKTWAVERWPVEKGWRMQQGFAREVSDEALSYDERVRKLYNLIGALNATISGGGAEIV